MGAMTTPAEQYAAAKKRGQHPLTTQFIEQFDFGFDEFQILACQAVEDGKGVLVAAPTGAGKTVVGEFAAFSALAQGPKCFYTTPIKALSNQKFAEFQERFGEARVGLLTGDTNINSEADILVMTTEVL
jgi:ATP-dependent RNA helicase HelY